MRPHAGHRARVALAAVGVVGALASTTAQSRASTSDWGGQPTNEFRSWVIDDGEFIYSNGVMQARGANVDGLHHTDYWAPIMTGGELPIDERDDVERHLTWGAFGVDRWATDGDYELPLDDATWPAFTAEIAELRLRLDGDNVAIRFRFTSMPRPDTQIATLTFANEDHADVRPWPHGAGVESPWQVAVTTWGTGGSFTGIDATPMDLAVVGGTVAVGDHVIEVTLPRALLPDGPWRLTGGAGLADPDDSSTYWPVPVGAATQNAPGSGSTLVTGPPVWSLLFAQDDEWVFTARAEGDLLASSDVSGASIVVDPVDLAEQRDVTPPPRTGRLARFHESAFDLGDGIVKGDPGQSLGPLELPPEVPLDDVARSFEYTGRLQPYGMLVPDAYLERTEPWPLIVYLHGLNNYYHEPFGTLPNLDDEVAARGYLFASLLGRGDLSYLGRGELDVMEALADIRAHYDVDPDQIHLMGHSMGSIGSFNVATRNPDLFAAGAPAEITSSNELIANLRHVPWMMVGGEQDFLDAGAESEETTYALMSDLGYDVTFYRYLMKTHESSSIYDTLPAMLDLFDRSTRVVDPGEFVYTRRANDDHPELGLVHDRVYQVADLRFADESLPQTVRVQSFAIPHRPLEPSAATRTDEMVDEGGPSGRTAAQKKTTVPGFGDPIAHDNRARLDLVNVVSLTIDVARLGLDPVAGFTIEVDTTDVVRLAMDGLSSALIALEVDGSSVTPAAEGDRVAVEVPAGQHVVRVVASGPSDPDAAGLPATGGGLALAALLALAAGLRSTRRAKSA